MFDFAHGNLPQCFANTWNTNMELRNPNNFMALRNDYDYHNPLVRLECFNKFPLSEFPRLWNEFESAEIQSISSINVFKQSLKEHYFSKLSESVPFTRLLCPSCHLNLNLNLNLNQ
jgi:hypothetical protein